MLVELGLQFRKNGFQKDLILEHTDGFQYHKIFNLELHSFILTNE